MAKRKDKRNKAHGGAGRKAQPKVAKKLDACTPMQSRFAKEFMKAETIAEAAIKRVTHQRTQVNQGIKPSMPSSAKDLTPWKPSASPFLR
ncbi:MAG: hypothetical protein WAK48_01610 [Candidatus Acidiferrum sp.]|jgi:hypothetical protein